VRIWIDMTAAAHVLVFRPIVQRLRARGHEVELTARDYSQTVELLGMHGLEATVVGRHGGANRFGKAAALARRTRALRRFARGRDFELALAHGSNDLALAAAMLRIPATNTFDYEFAVLQHNVGCRLARRVVVPDRIPPERLKRFGVGPAKLAQYPGLKEEYYLYDFEADEGVPDALGVDRERIVVVFRPPADVALYHRMQNPLFPQVLDRLGRDAGSAASTRRSSRRGACDRSPTRRPWSCASARNARPPNVAIRTRWSSCCSARDPLSRVESAPRLVGPVHVDRKAHA
jgi:predicted glycosyltransferase